MKIGIVSDMHLGYSRFEEDAFRQAKFALSEAASMSDVIIMPGDIFDFRFPKPNIIAQAIKILRPLMEREWPAKIDSFSGANPIYTTLPILAIPGTHERTAVGKENPLNLLSLAGIVADISEGTAVISKGDEKVAVYGLGGISDDKVKERLKELDPKPTKGMFNIFVMHQSVYDFMPFSTDFLKLDDLPEGFDLYIDGHIHNKIESKVYGKPFLIPGSTVLTQLKESEQDSKGFLLYDTELDSYQFINIPSRPFMIKTLKFSKSNSDYVYKKCDETINSMLNAYLGRPNLPTEGKIPKPMKPIVRLVLEGTIEAGTSISSLNLRSLVGKYSDSAHLEIDSKLSSENLEEELSLIRKSQSDNNMSIKDLGMEMLKKNSEALDIKDLDVTELFEILDEEFPPNKKQELSEKVMELFTNKKPEAQAEPNNTYPDMAPEKGKDQKKLF
ncbi:DNA repair exonuclease [Candidatus Mancarchaeum acidiphilum]|uniref:DNA repair exonuclease n=1 Tax=Candidatus Mancarchaeum acidiphilum TaxID=1920749 RepID=A0A218NP86_9ARCH|nr:DNA repair exonuclease [Candidatus Mancarchaeum acidiphilum]ASI14288.1 DNA repair exonuclease [Candidatus Mancarchaeum acidiphilum]